MAILNPLNPAAITAGFKADLHCHSHCSDGALAPSQLLLKAQQLGLQGLSITDHDTLSAYSHLSIPEHLALLSGIELSSALGRQSIHILGYGFELANHALNASCRALAAARITRVEQILSHLRRFQIKISLTELQQQFPATGLGRPHIAQMMVQKGYVKTPQLAFKRYLTDKRCSQPLALLSPEAAIELIHQAKGKAVLAHPQHYTSKALINTLLALPLDGVEGHYARLAPHQEQAWLRLAEQKNWFITGGSDFHTPHHPYLNQLGSSWTPPKTFELLYQCHLANNPTFPSTCD
jgi:predicted metal-dependent phosphoesterase TrpH